MRHSISGFEAGMRGMMRFYLRKEAASEEP